MTLPTKIAVIGAGSASFGENTLATIFQSKILRGSRLSLVDQNQDALEIIFQLSERLNKAWDANIQISTHLNVEDALHTDTDFVVSAIEVGAREGLWKTDYEIPLRYGVRQPYAENGGPGGFAHAARNIGPIMSIIRAIEETCPQAWFINYSNPMIRICDAVNRHSKIKAVGLCHQIYIGYVMAGIALAKDLGFEIPSGIEGMHAHASQYALHEQVKQQAVHRLDLQAAGLNHFTWMLSLRDRQTGEDLYPLFRERFFELDPSFEPLTRQVFEVFDLFPIPGDTHLSEYLPWMCDPITKPWEKYNIRLYDWELGASIREYQHERLRSMAQGISTIDGLVNADSEGALEIISSIAGNQTHFHLAANLPNHGQVADIPTGATVETPVFVNGSGIQPVHVGRLPLPIVEMMRRETTVAQLCVDSVIEGNRSKALQSLLLDPVIQDITTAQKILDSYLDIYKKYLPQFWRD